MIDTDVEIQHLQNPSPCDAVMGCPPNVSDDALCPKDARQWYVMRSTYSREMKAKAMLEAEDVECYVPMKHERTEQGDRYLPVVHNLIFVHITRSFMDAWKRRHEEDCPLRYAIDSITSKPMVVRDKEMEDFIRVTKDADDSIIYLDNPQVVVDKGKKVEIVCGQYEGVRGTVLRVLRDRKVVVSVSGLCAVALSGIPFAWIKELPTN